MAKRELIERENLLNELAESSKHHAQTSREESLLYRDRQIVREQPTITEQDIVEPYLEKVLAEVEKIPTLTPNTDGISMYGYKIKHPQEIKNEVIRLINNLISEQED